MSINACTINVQTINATCRRYPILTVSANTYATTVQQSTVYGPFNIAAFLGGPVADIQVISGTLNGPGGSLQFFADPGTSGNISFGGTATPNIGTYTGTVKIYGLINYQLINFEITVVNSLIGGAGGNPQHVNPNTKQSLSIFRRDNQEQEELPNVEQESVNVTVEFDGNRYSQTLKKSVIDQTAMISVSRFNIKTDDILVNIIDLQIKKAK